MLTDGQSTKWRINIGKNFNRLSKYRETTDRQTTDGRATAYSERECEFTFAKKRSICATQTCIADKLVHSQSIDGDIDSRSRQLGIFPKKESRKDECNVDWMLIIDYFH